MLSKDSIVTEQNESTGQSLFFRLVDWGLIALLVLAPLGIALLGFAWPRFRKLHETVLSVFFVVQANDPA